MHEYVIIIPIYCGHMERLTVTLGNVAGRLDGTQLVLCASNAWEQRFFRSLTTAFDAAIEVIDAEAIAAKLSPQAVERLRADTDQCTVNLKKLFAAIWCFENGAKGAAVLDSDVVLLPRFRAESFFRVLDHNHDVALAPGARTDNAMSRSINQACRTLLLPKGPDHPDIDPAWYGWYFDVPYYRQVDFLGMISYLTQLYPDGWWNHIGWHAFEHMVYTFYRVFRGEADLDIYESYSQAVPERLLPVQLRALWSKYNFLPAWISLTMFAQDPTLLDDNPAAAVLYHVDRCHIQAP